MPINVPVQLDNDSLNDVRDHAHSIFDSIGGDAGQGFTRGITRELDKIGPSFVRLGSIAEGALGGMSAGVLAATAGIAAMGAAVVLVGEQFYEMGSRFDAVSDSIAVRTGKMGDDLSGMMGSLNTVASNTASSIEDIGHVMERVSQSLGATGTDLEYLTKQISDLDRMTGEDLNIRDLGRVMRSFGQDAAKAASDLDSLEAASQRSGLPLNELLSTMVSTGPAARSLGMDFNELAGLLVLFEKGGIDSANAQMALNHAAGEFAKHGIDMKTGLADTIIQMKQFIDAQDMASARTLAGQVFGERAASRFVDLVAQSVLTVDSLHQGLGNTQGTIENLNRATADWHETWQQITNRVDILIDKIGGPLFDKVNQFLKLFAPDTPIWQQGQVPPFQVGTPSGTEQGYVHPQGPYVPTVIPPGGWQPHTYDQSTAPKPGQPGFIGPVPVGTPTGPQMGAPPGTPPPPPGGPGAPPNQDVAGALGQDANKPGGNTGKPGMPAVPMPAEYGQPPRPGETLEDWQQRQRVMEAENALETSKARVAQMEAANNDTDEKNNFTADELTRARNEVAQAEGRLYAIENQNVKQRRQNLDEVQVPYPAGFGAPPRPGETAEQYGREQSALDATHKREEAEARLAQIRNDAANYSQNDLQKAENAVTAARENEYEAIMRLNTATKEGTDQLGEFGAKLDADFGMSKGLPGLAENLFKFLANLTFSPVFGAMRGAQAGLGFPGGQGSGSGVMGMIGSALGIGQTDPTSIGQLAQSGLSGALGSTIQGQQQTATQDQQQTATAAARQPYGLPKGTDIRQGAAGFPDWVYQLAAQFNLKASTYAGHQETNRPDIGAAPNPGGQNRGIDWWGSQADMDRFAQYLSDNGLAEQVIHMDPNTGKKYGYPAWVDYSGSYGDETTMVHTRFSQSPGTVPSTQPTRSSTVRGNWDAVAQNESSGNWSTNTGNGYYGGLQFSQSSWDLAKPPGAPARADLATVAQQKAAADKLLSIQGPGAWPNTFVASYAEGGAIPIIAHEGEHVLTAGDVKAMGGQQAVYGFRAGLQQKAGAQGQPPTPPPPVGAVMPTFGGTAGGPMPGASPVGAVAPSAGHGTGFSVTGSGLVGLLESTPATAIEMAISAGAAAHEFGGAVEWPSFDGGGGVSSMGGQPGATGQMGGAPGGSLISAAINIGMEELNAGISAAGRAIAAGVGGLQQTFGMQQFAQTPLAQGSWLTRFVGGFMGAQPQLPNLAGMKSAPPPPSMSGGPAQKAGTVGPSSGPIVHIENYNANAGEHSAGADIARHTQAAYAENSLTGSR